MSELFRISFESFKTYKICPLKWRYKYVDREAVFIDKTFTVAGSIVHNLAQTAHETKDLNVLERDFETTFKKYGDVPSVDFSKTDWKDRQTAYTAIQEMALTLARLLERESLTTGNNVIEHRFGSYENPLDIGHGLGLLGGFDILNERNGVWRLADYKSSLNTRNVDADQLILYQLGVVKQFAVRPAMCGFIFFRYGLVDWHRFTAEREAELLSRVINAVARLRDRDYTQTPSSAGCKRCDYAGICPFAHGKTSSVKAKPQLRSKLHEVPEL